MTGLAPLLIFAFWMQIGQKELEKTVYDLHKDVIPKPIPGDFMMKKAALFIRSQRQFRNLARKKKIIAIFNPLLHAACSFILFYQLDPRYLHFIHNLFT